MRNDAIFGRRKIRFIERLIDGRSIVPAVGQADAGAADQILAMLTFHEGSQAGPQHHDDGAAAIIGVDAGAACLGDAAAQIVQAAQVEFLF